MLAARRRAPIDASTFEIVRRLALEHFGSYARRYAGAFVLMSIFAGCTALTAWLMKDVVNRIFVAQDRHAMVWLPLVICGLFIVKGFAAYFQEVSLAQIGNRIVADTQRRLFGHVLQMDASFFLRQSSAELVTCISQRAGAVRDVLNILALGVGRDLFTLLSLLAVMLSQDVMMTAMAVVVGPIIAVGLRRLTKRVRNAANSEFQSMTNVVATMRESAQGIRIVKSFQLEPVMEQRMGDAIGAVERVNNKLTQIQSLTNPLIETAGGVAVAGVVAYAGWRSVTSGQTPGELFAFLTALLMAADPLRRLSRLQLQLAAAAAGARTLYAIIDTPVRESRDATPALAVDRGEVSFDGVSFAYQANASVLRDLSFKAQGGKVTAIVGLSGSGKTTVFNLIQKLWHPDAGRISIDDQQLTDISTLSLRSQISLVSQDVFLFEGTIRENIEAGAPSTSEAALRAAARAANIDTFIESLPHGYNTPVGELGAMLSGGQRQRISIARAFLKNARIILLDEPTAALDSHSEQHIQLALARLMKGRTTIVIAHRLSTVAAADRIIVLSEGSVAEAGSHAELMQLGGLYAHLYKVQFSSSPTTERLQKSA
ncbi:ABC transporter ATP-binding protein [Hyphomicrobium sp. D-2]|uniref:ABC transporter ATP-binding protein n=1 Tax=Hyphomicrobium sp. D-2 TaxID=3041621 RepID=UPI0024542F95|nr:ABC transporter ATP-binding protein [Hyphomicrobium sp. D-2]MDH4981181.1 ABC transporter ATP-binding protein [Hyphomicrobium sp. D-2]